MEGGLSAAASAVARPSKAQLEGLVSRTMPNWRGVGSMMKRDARWGLRFMALLALIALALGAASCGGDDDDGGSAGGGDAAAQGQSQDSGDPVPVDNSPEGQIRAAHTKFIDVFYKKEPGPICDLLSRKGQREWITKTAKTCEAGLFAVITVPKQTPRKPAPPGNPNVRIAKSDCFGNISMSSGPSAVKL